MPNSHACVCVCALLGRLGRIGLPGASWCASPFLRLFCPSSLLGPLRAGVALFVFLCLRSFVFFSVFPLDPPLLAPPLSPAFCAFQPRVPFGLALFIFLCPPPHAPPPSPFFFFPPVLCPPVLSGVLFFPTSGFLGLGAAPFPSPPLFFALCLPAIRPGAPKNPPLCCFLFFFLPPPTTGVYVVPCAAWCCTTAPAFCLVFCVVKLPCSVLRVLLWWPALCCCGLLRVVRCSLGWLLVCCAVLWRAVGCCCVLSRVLGRGVPLRCSRCGLRSPFDLRRRVPCCVPGCCAAPHCVASSVQRCAVVRWVVSSRSVWCRCLLCRALGHCPSPWDVVPSGTVFGLASLRCVPLFAAVLGAVCALGCRAVCSLCFPLCAVPCRVVLVCLPRDVSLVCALSSVWCGGTLLRAVMFPLLFCGAVLRCAVVCVVCCAAARCAMFACALSRCAAAPVVRCCGVPYSRACVVPLCCALLPLCCWVVSCGAACGFCLFVAGPCCPLLLPGGVLQRWYPWLVV